MNAPRSLTSRDIVHLLVVAELVRFVLLVALVVVVALSA